MKRFIIALALFMPTSAMAGQITMDCGASVHIGPLASDDIRYSEGIFYDTIELRVEGEWKEAEFGDGDENTRISDHSATWTETRQYDNRFYKYVNVVDFFSGGYWFRAYKSPDGTDGSWEFIQLHSFNCDIIK